MIDKLDDNAKEIMRIAQYEASKYGGISVRPNHVLLAMLAKQDRQVLSTLRLLGVEPDDLRGELEDDLGTAIRVKPGPDLPLDPATQAALEYAHREAVETAESKSAYEVTPLHLLIGLARVPGAAKDTVVPTKAHMEQLRAHARGRSSGAASKSPHLSPSGVGRCLVVWDPDVLSPEEYAELVTLLGDVVRAHGGVGLRRFDLQTVGVLSGVGASK